MNFKAYPLLFKPVYQNKIWGGDKLSRYTAKDIPQNEPPVAESWLICDRDEACSVVVDGEYADMPLRQLVEQWPKEMVSPRHRKEEAFPLIVKLIDAGQRLSLQVHPDEITARKFPGAQTKNELFYVLEHDEGAKIFAGLKHNKTQSQFRGRVNAGENSSGIEDCLQVFPSRNGDAYYIPAGTVHSIGAGNLILEIQQNSDTTFRVTDWGRLDPEGKPRRLDTQEALDSIHFKERGLPLVRADESNVYANKKRNLVRPNKYFKVEELKLKSDFFSDTKSKSFHLLTAVDCDFSVKCQAGEFHVAKGESCLLPAALGSYGITPQDSKIYTIMRSMLSM